MTKHGSFGGVDISTTRPANQGGEPLAGSWPGGLNSVCTGIDAANCRRTIAAACERAGVDRIVPYELRHTAITYQIEAGHDSWNVADWAGTSEKMIEEIYRHRLNRVSKLGPVEFCGAS